MEGQGRPTWEGDILAETRGGKGGLTSVICRKSVQAVGTTAAKAPRWASAEHSGGGAEMSLVGYRGGVGCTPRGAMGARDCSGERECCLSRCSDASGPGPGQAVGPHL